MDDHPFNHIYLDPDFGSNSPSDLAARQQALERMERLNRRLELERVMAQAVHP